jgi:uncharacterized protein (TIGR02145 family)
MLHWQNFKNQMKNRLYPSIVCLCLLLLIGCKKEDEKEIIIERGTVTDIEGSVYITVKIGDQWWMAENLRVATYNDGTPLDFIPVTFGADTAWANADSGAYCFINADIFGYLYNDKVLKSGKNIAPAGWHVPTDEDWQKLERTIGMKSSEIIRTGWRGEEEANALTSKYNLGWPANNSETGLFGNDVYGFNAKPSSIRGYDGRTNIQSNSAWWWTSTSDSTKYYYRSIDTYHREIFRQLMLESCGLSIRCVKD